MRFRRRRIAWLLAASQVWVSAGTMGAAFDVPANPPARGAATAAAGCAAAEIEMQCGDLAIDVWKAAAALDIAALPDYSGFVAGTIAEDARAPETANTVPAAPSRPAKEGPVALSDEELDGMRGGFEFPNGLSVTFGIDRVVYINGQLVATTSLNVDLGRIVNGQIPVTVATGAAASAGSATVSAGGTAATSVTATSAGAGATTAAAAVGNPATTSSVVAGVPVTVVQNGAGNVFVADAAASANSLATVIQNSLDNQRIQTMTIINATVNSLQMQRAMIINSMMRDALVNSLRR